MGMAAKLTAGQRRRSCFQDIPDKIVVFREIREIIMSATFDMDQRGP
jgi:hypothetical protein